MCRKLPFHYAWIICLCAGLLMFCYIGISGNCFSIYLTYTRSEWSYSNSQISAFNTIRMLSSLLALFSMRRFYRRFSLRTGVTFWCAMLGLSYALCALAARPAFFFLAAAVMGYSGGMGSLAAASMLVRRWFHDRLGLAIGLFSSATGLATVLAPALITRLLESRGLRFTYVATGCFIALIALAVGLLVRSNPAELGMAPYTVASSPDAPRRKAVVTRCRGAITRGEWLFFGAALSSSASATPRP